VDTMIVVLPRNLTWLNLRSWLCSGIRKNLIRKCRALSFVRILSVLDSDMLLDARGLGGSSIDNLSQLEGLPAQITVLSSVKVSTKSTVLSASMVSVPPHTNQEFGFRTSWEGRYVGICDGVGQLALQLAEGLASTFQAEQTLTLDIVERITTSGLTNSLDAYKAMCKASQCRIGLE
jgi:hypothetical protein